MSTVEVLYRTVSRAVRPAFCDGKVSKKIASLDGSEVFGSQVQKFKTLYFLNGMEILLKFIIVYIDRSENRKKNEDLEFKLIQVPKIIKNYNMRKKRP